MKISLYEVILEYLYKGKIDNMQKAIIRKCAYKIFSKDPEKLYKIIKKYDVVSFDIFDTLIKRNTETPEDVFKVVALLSDKKFSNFPDSRIRAEQLARREAENGEVTLTEIYEKLIEFSASERSELMNLEIEVEKKLCCAYFPMQKIYNWCKKNNKIILLISDMYLNTSIISEILKKSGYDPSDRLYISCEYKKSKAAGEIYDEIKKELKGKAWIHIGDSIRGDFLMARKHGISSQLIARDLLSPKYYFNNPDCSKNGLLFRGYLKSFIQNHERKELNDFEKIGYEILGPLLTGFCVWLNKQLSGKRYDSVLFLARDAKIILECYKKLFGNSLNNIYFYISRKAAIATSVDLLSEYQELHDLLLAKDSANIGDLCNALNIKGNNLNQFLKESKVDLKLQVNSDKNFDGEALLVNAKKYANCDSENQRNLLLAYLKNENVIDNFAIVDLGWEGRTQWVLKKILPNSIIDGYYIGTITKCENLINSINMNSYLGKMKSTDYYARVIMESIALFESLFLTNEGTTIGYRLDSTTHKTVPIQAQPDQEDENRVKIEQLQMGAMQFINDIKEDKMFLEYKWDADVILGLSSFLCKF